MSRRFEARLKLKLPVKLIQAEEKTTFEGLISDISPTHFRAEFSTPLSTIKKYNFEISLPNLRHIQGRVTIDKPKTATLKRAPVFIIENLQKNEERILSEFIKDGNNAIVDGRRSRKTSPEYKDNRRNLNQFYNPTKKRRVVISGIGLVAPNAIGRAKFWDAIRTKRSGIRENVISESSQFPLKFSGGIDISSFNGLMPSKRANHLSRATQFGWIASKLALDDAQLDLDGLNLDFVGVAMGTTLGTMDWAFEQYAAFLRRGCRAVNPYTIAAGSPNALSGEISAEFGFRGPSFTIAQGCSSSSMAIAQGLDLIQLGKADIMLVGGAEASLDTPIVNAFIRGGLLSDQIPTWKNSMISRDDCIGSILSDGACVLVLESYESAIERGVSILGELMASGTSTDGYHMVVPHPSGRGVSLAIRQAIRNSGIPKEEIDLLIGHFPGVKVIYDLEMRVFEREFGSRLQTVPITNIKPLIGYTQGACSSFEVAAACLSFQEPIQWITYGQGHPPIKASCALINCIGFGGKNATLIIKKFDA